MSPLTNPEEVVRKARELILDKPADLSSASAEIPSRGVIISVTDYPHDDLASAEVQSAHHCYLPLYWHVVPSPVEKFNTIHTAFIVQQHALKSPELRPGRLVLFVNCAPRKDLTTPRSNNEGEGLVYGRLKNGVEVVAVNSGYSLSFLRDHFATLHDVTIERGRSQFRSRDFFPAVQAHVIHRTSFLEEILGTPLDPRKVIPDIHELEPTRLHGLVCHIDNFGNVKTSFRTSKIHALALEEGAEIPIRIGNSENTARVSSGSFNVKVGELAFSPGSSGHDDPFWELFRRGESAKDMYKGVEIGATVELVLPH